MHITPTLELEQTLFESGYRYVIGVDEAGRGPWAGPLTAGAVIIDTACRLDQGVRDSKFMNAQQREQAYETIPLSVCGWGVSIVEHAHIDLHGMSVAVLEAMEEAVMAAMQQVSDATIENTFVIVDGSKTLPLRNCRSRKLLRGGALHASISAASIMAKVTRDRLMHQYDETFPRYGFALHKGYGTTQHQQALQQWGPCPIHRQSFAPIRRFLENAD